MTAGSAGSRVPPGVALAAACQITGLESDGASVLYDRSNTVFKLARQPVVVRLRYAPGSEVWLDRLSVSVKVTAWLCALGFPAVRPLEVAQPVAAEGYVVTFWHYIAADGPPGEDVEALGRLVRRLHSVGPPPVGLPPAKPLSSLHEDAARCEWLPNAQRRWVLDRAETLSRLYDATAWTLGCGLIHGDAWADNLIPTREGAVLADWDSVSNGPRELDIVPSLIRRRFGRPAQEWVRFCAAYGVDPYELPQLDLLREMRELRTLVPYLRSRGSLAAQAEVGRRIDDLINGTQSEPWQALNLASA
jgi:aminoglycoside phosphotransferase (APT) family kinase protein